LKADRLNIDSGVDKTGPHFAKNAYPVEAQTALYSELALETANVIETGGREVIQFAFERQIFRQIECQPASSSDIRCDAAGPSSYHGKLSAHFDLRLLRLSDDGPMEN